MASFNSWNGKKVHGDYYLLTEVLKNQMGFDGFVVGDWNGHGQIPGCSNGSCPASLNAGVDMNMVPENWKDLYRNTLRQVRNGEISIERLDDAVRRIISVKHKLGLFDGKRPSNSPFNEVGLQHNRDIARQAVRESMVLLKNNNNVLPLKKGQKILVIGIDANSLKTQTGGWTLDWQGTNNRNIDFPGSIPFLSALIEKAGQENIDYVENLTQVNNDYDVAIVVYGEQPYAEGVGDRKNLNFDGSRHISALNLLKEKEIPTVSIFLTGRPLWVTREINLSDSFVVAWLPGTESRGMTDVLFHNGTDDYDFSGKLPFSWPRNTKQANLNYFDATSNPLFNFGYGLTYQEEIFIKNLDEGENSVQKIDSIELMNGTINDKFIGFMRESDLAEVQISSNRASSQNGLVSTDLIDVNIQDDTLNINFQKSEYLNSFFLLSKEILDLSSLSDGYINLTARVNDTGGEVKYILSCGVGCFPVIDLTEFFQTSKEFKNYSIPIECFTNYSNLDLTRVNLPMYLATQGPLNIDISKAYISRDRGDKVLSCY
jgi:beta-glucosidase